MTNYASRIALAVCAIGLASTTASAQTTTPNPNTTPPPATTPPAATPPTATQPTPPPAAAAQPAPPAAGQDALPPVDVVQPKEKAAKKAAPAKKAVAKKQTPKAPPPAEPAPVAATAPVDAAPAATSTAPVTPGNGGIASGTVNMSPVSGSAIPIEKVPLSVGRTDSSDIARTGAVTAQEALQATVPGIVISDAQGNVFQTSVQFRGYEASPVNGIPQGLAVYQNGTRINEAFGDIVNWDFIPSNAIDSMTVLGSNPVYGLNAIGGAIGITMRDGFNFQGVELDTRFGSFGRIQGSAAAGLRAGNWGIFGAFEGINDDGYRDFSDSEVRRGYADLGFRGSDVEMHLSFTGAKNSVGVTAAAPNELLDLDRQRTFTSPQLTDNEMQMVQLSAAVKATPSTLLSGNIYFRHFKQKHVDGNILGVDNPQDDINDLGCNPGDTTICVETDPLEDAAGNILDQTAFPGSIFGVIDRTSQDADSFGGTVQAVSKTSLFGHNNQLTYGVSYDHGKVQYNTSSEFGTFLPRFVVQGTGIILGGEDFIARDIATKNDYFGAFVTNTYDLTERLALTVGGRYNYAKLNIDNNTELLLNQEDTLSGTSKFVRFNPSAGLTYQIFSGLSAYGGYSEANRAPTTAELACSDPDQPCLIESALVSDPPLKQVVSRTFELGLRGNSRTANGEQTISWSFGGFHSRNEDDIINIASATNGRGFFDNIGETQRQGIEAAIQYRNKSLFTYATYSFTDAEFKSSFEVSSPDNPAAVECIGNTDENCVNVRSGDRLPGIPAHKFKTGFDYWVTPKWKFGADMIAMSNQVFFGDEGNDNSKLPGYAKVNLHTSYDLTDHIQFYGLIDNVFNTEYGLFGTYFDVDAGNYAANADPALGGNFFAEGNAKTQIPAPPIVAYGGMKVRF